MTPDEIVTEWDTLTQRWASDPVRDRIRDWVRRYCEGVEPDVAEVWFAGVSAATMQAPEAELPVALNPTAMAEVGKRVEAELAGERPDQPELPVDAQPEAGQFGYRDVHAELIALLRARESKEIGLREYVERLQVVQRRLGLPVFDGLNEQGQPTHPALLVDVIDLLPQRYFAALEKHNISVSAEPDVTAKDEACVLD